MTPEQTKLLTLDVAAFLHTKRHRSKKTFACASDIDLATEIVEMVMESKGEYADEDDQRS